MAIVRLFAAARAAAGVSQIDVSAASVREALDIVAAMHPGLSAVLPQCSLLLDEVACRDLTMGVVEGSVIDVLPPFAGG